MAFGHSVKRGGFDAKLKNQENRYVEDDSGGTTGDEQIKGTDNPNTLDGADGDDVIIGGGGADYLIGGDGEDDLSGGDGGDVDTLVGGSIDGDLGVSEVWTQDDYSDDYNAASSLEENGSDIIIGYDDDASDTSGTEGVVDVIDFSEAFTFTDPDPSDFEFTAVEKEGLLNAELSYDSSTGELSDVTTGDSWFTVYSDNSGTEASTVYVEVDGDVFQWDSGWVLQENWDMV